MYLYYFHNSNQTGLGGLKAVDALVNALSMGVDVGNVHTELGPRDSHNSKDSHNSWVWHFLDIQ